MFAQQNRDIADEGDESDDAPNDVFFAVEERLAGGIKLGVVCDIVVALGEESEG